jgi:hypothetical protein|nr:MAG TPA: hypothetical protein [Crassvirales sp.]
MSLSIDHNNYQDFLGVITISKNNYSFLHRENEKYVILNRGITNNTLLYTIISIDIRVVTKEISAYSSKLWTMFNDSRFRIVKIYLGRNLKNKKETVDIFIGRKMLWVIHLNGTYKLILYSMIYNNKEVYMCKNEVSFLYQGIFNWLMKKTLFSYVISYNNGESPIKADLRLSINNTQPMSESEKIKLLAIEYQQHESS